MCVCVCVCACVHECSVKVTSAILSFQLYSVIYSENELDNIFKLFDLRERGYITKDQCKKALVTIAHSEFHYKKVLDEDIPDKVNIGKFKELW